MASKRKDVIEKRGLCDVQAKSTRALRVVLRRTRMTNESKGDRAPDVLFSDVIRFIGVLVLACHGRPVVVLLSSCCRPVVVLLC